MDKGVSIFALLVEFFVNTVQVRRAHEGRVAQIPTETKHRIVRTLPTEETSIPHMDQSSLHSPGLHDGRIKRSKIDSSFGTKRKTEIGLEMS